MNDIQKARDVLAKWRKEARYGQWFYSYLIPASKNLGTIDGDMGRSEFYVASDVTSEDARLIIGTAGNPDLLNAIDALFDVWARAASWGAREFQVDKIAAAIIAADERMQQ